MILRRLLTTASAASPAAPASASAGQRPSALLEAYTAPAPPRAEPPDAAWRRDMYAVMAATPARECTVTRARLPSAFMASFRVSDDPAQAGAVLPDRLEHPRYKRRRAGRAFWTALHRDAVQRLFNTKGPHFRYLKHPSHPVPAYVSPDVVRLVDEGLVERVLQEATLLAQRTPGQRHLVPFSEVRKTGRARIQPTRDGHVLAVLDLTPPKDGPRVSAESEGEALPRLPPVQMSYRHDGPEAIPHYNIHELYGDRAGEFVRLLRGMLDEDVLALQSPLEGEPAGVPLAVALWRRVLFHGHGWKVKQ